MDDVVIKFSTSNAAFCEGGEVEVASVLRDIAHDIENGSSFGVIRDSNGNRIGEYHVTLYDPNGEELD